MSNDKIDIGNVRGEKGETGERGEKGPVPSYDQIRYKTTNGVKQPIMGKPPIKKYTLDAEGKLCDEDGFLIVDGVVTTTKGVPFDESVTGYEYKPIFLDDDGKRTNENGERLDENEHVMYVPSEFISDIIRYLYEDNEAYDQITLDTSNRIVETILASLNDPKFKDYFDKIEGDIKCYVCADNPKNSIFVENGVLHNTCKYYDDNGELAVGAGGNYLYVPLEKNALYFYNTTGTVNNDIMHYDIYVCTVAGKVPIKLVSSADFKVDYNVIDEVRITPHGEDDAQEVFLEIITRGTRGQFYSIKDVDQLFKNNVINKLGKANGIAQLNSSRKIPASQLPSFVDDVIEGTMSPDEHHFTPSDPNYVGQGNERSKIYVDINTRKCYRWSGSDYIIISNYVAVDDGGSEAFASGAGQALKTLIGTATLQTTKQTVTEAINEHEDDINSINSVKQNKEDNTLQTNNKTVVGAINELKNSVNSSNHSHGNISGDGKLNTSNSPVVTDGNKKITTGTIGTDKLIESTKLIHIGTDVNATQKSVNVNINSKINEIGSVLQDKVDLISVEDSLSQTSIYPVQNRTITHALNNKSNVNHSHSIDSIPNLTNTLNGKANTNHAHGNITSEGKLPTPSMPVITNNNGLITTGKISSLNINEATALNNIGANANSSQSSINYKVDMWMGNIGTEMNNKANISDVYTKQQVDDMIQTSADLATDSINLII